MNLADLMTVLTFLGCPVAAGLAAASEKAGWFTILFIAFGAAMGFAGRYCVGRLAYLLLFACCKQSRAWLSAPLFAAYMFAPMIAALGMMGLTSELTSWLVRHIL